MYVAVKGGEAAIRNAHRLLADRRRGSRDVPALTLEQIAGQLGLSLDRVMAEGSLYDVELAAMAMRQSRGDLIEAIFLLRAYRTTLPRFGNSVPVDTGRMAIERRVSATYKDLPGGQLLGPTFDYTHRLIDPAMAGDEPVEPGLRRPLAGNEACPRVTDILGGEGLIEPDTRPAGTAASAGGDKTGAAGDAPTAAAPGSEAGIGAGPLPASDADPVLADAEPGDLTREPLSFPAGRDLRLQALARGDEGFLLSLAYSTQRGFARTHPFVGEIRIGLVDVEVEMPELGFPVTIGRVRLTECQMVNQFSGSAKEPPQFTRGYGLVFGQSERKAMAMSLVDRALRADEFGEERVAVAQDEEFVIAHSDNVAATGFVEHLKLPHYVDFQAELDLVRRMRAEHAAASSDLKDAAE